jgi:penicillin-binding protein 2
MLIRPIQAYYPPGSAFKPLAALVALQKGIITPQTTVFCAGGYRSGNRWVRCTHHHGTTNLSLAIQGSCNAYFSSVFERVMNQNGARNIHKAYDEWKQDVNMFGFGTKLDVDLPNERRGFVPTSLWYDNAYKNGRWRSGTILSLAIGQGELLATPLQLANIECTIANHGFYYKPHLIKAIGDKKIIKEEYTKRNYVGIDANYFEPVIEGMQNVVDRGTAIGSRIPGITMCGKTGTAQNPHGKNHSVFVAFAPRENPKIAIAVIVENSGDGGTWAAPIASFIVEKYLRDSITRRPSGIFPEYYENENLLPALKPKIKISGKAAKDSILKKRGVETDTTKKEIIIREAKRKSKNKIPNRLAAVATARRENEQ